MAAGLETMVIAAGTLAVHSRFVPVLGLVVGARLWWPGRPRPADAGSARKGSDQAAVGSAAAG